ncbi:MAG: GTPase Era [Ignavibacteria bacterium]
MNEPIKKCGTVAIIGKPNAGKSTLLNTLLGYNLSIVTKKAQTTRNKILGVLTENNYQMIFFDTPGILEPKYELHNFMIGEVKSSLKDSDVVVLLIDPENFSLEDITDFKQIFKRSIEKKPIILAINKADKPEHLKLVKSMIEVIKKKFQFEDIIFISALTGYNVDDLKLLIVKYLPNSEFLYDEETLTDKSERFFVAEIIREKILELYKEEIPYSVFVDIREFKERPGGKDFINADIVVERESQKKIILGKKGEMIKTLGELARKKVENFLGREVYLELYVKVKKDWRKDKAFLKYNFQQT